MSCHARPRAYEKARHRGRGSCGGGQEESDISSGATSQECANEAEKEEALGRRRGTAEGLPRPLSTQRAGRFLVPRQWHASPCALAVTPRPVGQQPQRDPARRATAPGPWEVTTHRPADQEVPFTYAAPSTRSLGTLSKPRHP